MTDENRPLPNFQHFNILSLDGGGVRGALSSVILARLVELWPALIRDADLIVGTSTGAIQALELANGKPPHNVPELYTKGAEFIFKDSLVDDVRDLWRLTGADYSNTNLRNLLELEFGAMTLGELSKRVAVVAFNLDHCPEAGARRSWKAKVFHNIEHNVDADLEARIVDVALASSAAPVFFPTAGTYIDGGVVANNPAMVGLAQALDRRGPNSNKDNVQLNRINLLSLGTGKSPRYVEGENLDWGAANWAPHILNIVLEGPVDMVSFQCRQLLGAKYHRINPILPEKVSLDDWESVSGLVEFAKRVDLTAAMGWLETNWL